MSECPCRKPNVWQQIIELRRKNNRKYAEIMRRIAGRRKYVEIMRRIAGGPHDE